MKIAGEAGLEEAVDGLPLVVAEAMRMGIDESEIRIGAFAYETELAMCPIAAAVRYAETRGKGGGDDWDPAWGSPEEFRRRVSEFVDRFDRSAEDVGLDETVEILRNGLARRALDSRGF
jgi:hypothetical protein